jgi:hypothetical protein
MGIQVYHKRYIESQTLTIPKGIDAISVLPVTGAT